MRRRRRLSVASVLFFVIAFLHTSCKSNQQNSEKNAASVESRSAVASVAAIWTSLFRRRKRERRIDTNTTEHNNNKNQEDMGQAMRIVKYDRAANERNAVSALQMADIPLQWFRLDDGVMGGKSETNHAVDAATGILHFTGTINTDGGGFASIRSKIPEGSLSRYEGIKLRVRGDGKTYKFFMTDGTGAGPFASKPSWQCDVPTVSMNSNDSTTTGTEWQEVVIPFHKLLPSFAGGVQRAPTDEIKKKHTFDAGEMREMGLMLSLKLSDGRSNPKETFGQGLFPFSLLVQSIEPLESSSSSTSLN